MKHLIAKYIEDGELNFDRLISELMEKVDQGLINHKIKGDLHLFDYNQNQTMEGNWSTASRISRGLVLDVVNQRIVALPLEKFFNYGGEHKNHGRYEGAFEIEHSYVHEKLDGSMGIAYYYNDKWHVNTRGSFESEQALWATEFLEERYDTSKMNRYFTYIFEIIYPENKIVVDYNGAKRLVLLAVNNNLTLDEIPHKYLLEAFGHQDNPDLPKQWLFDHPDEIAEFSNTLSKDEEGYVVTYPSGVRVKIKGQEYCRIHKILSHFSPLSVWECYRDKGAEGIQEIKIDLPEEFWVEMDTWVASYQKHLDELSKAIKLAHKPHSHLSNKDLGLYLNNDKTPLGKWFFEYRKDKDLTKMGRKTRTRLFEEFKPKSNILIPNKEEEEENES